MKNILPVFSVCEYIKLLFSHVPHAFWIRWYHTTSGLVDLMVNVYAITLGHYSSMASVCSILSSPLKLQRNGNRSENIICIFEANILYNINFTVIQKIIGWTKYYWFQCRKFTLVPILFSCVTCSHVTHTERILIYGTISTHHVFYNKILHCGFCSYLSLAEPFFCRRLM